MNSSRIAKERKRLGYSQEELANRLKVSQKSISKYERGTRRPSYETLLAMASLFKVSTDYLLGKTDDPNEEEQSEPEYTTHTERLLLELYRKYEDDGYSSEIESEIRKFFPEMAEHTKLSLTDEKILSAFKRLNEDNQDIIIGRAKELLKEQIYAESPVAADDLKRVSGK